MIHFDKGTDRKCLFSITNGMLSTKNMESQASNRSWQIIEIGYLITVRFLGHLCFLL